MEKLQALNVLANGVKVYALPVGNDIEKAQTILDASDVTSIVDAGCAYEERAENALCNVYEMQIDRKDDFSRFYMMLEKEKCFNVQYDNICRSWYRDEISNGEYNDKLTALRNCNCGKCSFRLPTLQEWKEGVYEEKFTVNNEHFQGEKIRKVRLNKALQKAGFSQEIVDFYSAQIKTEKTIYLTISGYAQFVAGMSYYAKIGSWNGYNGTSCQDTRHSGNYCIKLAGALHDDKLFVAMLHDNIDDLYDMTDKLKARSIMRLVNIGGNEYMLASKYYGNNETSEMIDYALKQLTEIGIYSYDIHRYKNDAEMREHKEPANGAYNLYVCKDIYVYEEIDEEIEINCPLCNGRGRIWREDDEEREHRIECPACNGTGDYTVTIQDTIETTVEVEVDENILPYDCEGWEHCENSIYTTVNMTMIRADNEKYGR